MPEIQLVRVGLVNQDVIDFLVVALSDSLGVNCTILGDLVDPSGAFNPARQQYNSMDILLALTRLEARPGAKLLGLAAVDLFIPILTFVFGQAQLNNRNAVMSVYRLHQSYYGLPESQRLFYARCEKEALHELGHTFGLVHCPSFQCVMYFSNSVEQVDLKTNRFCSLCREKLESSGLRRTLTE